jgi:hypothetical protein
MNANPMAATVTMSGHRLILVILWVPWDSTQAMASWATVASSSSASSAIVRRWALVAESCAFKES